MTQCGLHIPTLFGALVDQGPKTGTAEGYVQMMTRQTQLYAEVLAQSRGVLCALPIDAQVWLFEDTTWKDQLSAERVESLFQAVERKSTWLRSLDGRYEDGGEKPGHLWEAGTVVRWLAARAGLPAPTS